MWAALAFLAALVLVGGCVAPVAEVEDPYASVADLWADAVEPGGVLLGPVVVTSPRTATGASFYVQDPGGGQGLRVDLGGFLLSVPPPVGTLVELDGGWSREPDGAPVLNLADERNLTDLGDTTAPVATPWDGDVTLQGALISAADVEITSATDPAGRADTSAGLSLSGRFGAASPGRLARGDLVGILVEGDAVALRSDADWSGTRPGDVAEDATIAEIRAGAFPDGAYVRVEGTQLAPWAADGRWTAIGDGDAGLWIDGEGWGIAGTSDAGDRVVLVGEVRTDGDGPYLRCWTLPAVTGTGEATARAIPEDGSLFTLTVEDPGAADVYGDRPTADGWILDDRLAPVDGIADGDVVTGVVRGADRLAVLPAAP